MNMEDWQTGYNQAMQLANVSFYLGKQFGHTRKYNSFGDPVDELWYNKGAEYHDPKKSTITSLADGAVDSISNTPL